MPEAQTARVSNSSSEFQGSITVPADASIGVKLFKFLGPGLLVAVGYMDPGNWATDIEAGARFGYMLLCIVLLSSISAIALQYLSLKIGLVTGKDLASLSREHFSKKTNFVFWIFAEIAIIATDIAEVLGSALALKLLFNIPLLVGVLITILDTFIVLGLKGRGFRTIEAIVLVLVGTIGACFLYEIIMVKPDWPSVFSGYLPHGEILKNPDSWYLAIGILGATVMPHNLYLHSAIVQTRKIDISARSKKESIQLATFDTILSLAIAFLINSAILIVAASAFHGSGQHHVNSIEEAHHFLEPIVGTALAPLLFAIALLASGQSSTFTGVITGQVILTGYLNLNIPSWKLRLITRSLALIPALIGVSVLGENSSGKLIVLSQVALSLLLPFTIFPLVKFASTKKIMGPYAIGPGMKVTAWFLFAIIVSANLWMLWQTYDLGTIFLKLLNYGFRAVD